MMGSPEKFFWCDLPGSGLAVKIANNYISCTTILTIAEAMAIGVRQGVDPALLYNCIKNSTGQSWMCDNVLPVPNVLPQVPSSNGYKPGFKSQMMIKDISLGVEAGKQVGIEPRTAEVALKVFEQAAVDPRCVDRDGSSVYLWLTGDEEADYAEKPEAGAPQL
jgi:3-hydroxyisobutyrate/3-hydroxypropionate dehydrogenase